MRCGSRALRELPGRDLLPGQPVRSARHNSGAPFEGNHVDVELMLHALSFRTPPASGHTRRSMRAASVAALPQPAALRGSCFVGYSSCFTAHSGGFCSQCAATSELSRRLKHSFFFLFFFFFCRCWSWLFSMLFGAYAREARLPIGAQCS